MEAGCDDYEPKPIDFTRLMGKMQALLKHDA
jgi:DNA-binding response OmpR family regulator